MNIHKSIVHAKCPINGKWDYYTVRVKAKTFVESGELEKLFDEVRGSTWTQEGIAEYLKSRLPECKLNVVGRHTQSTKLTVSL